jgi:cyclic-di-GMP phosphodiesterase TipF (flagellum assembly factor)
MTPQFAEPEAHLVAQEPLYVRLGDALVIVSATLVSLAAGAWLIIHLDLDLAYAILAALGAYCALLLLHLGLRRTLMDGTEADDIESENDVHWQTGAAAFDAALSRHAAETERAASAGEAPLQRSPFNAWTEPLPMPEAEPAAEASDAFKYRPARLPYFEAPDEPAPAKDAEVAAPRVPVGGALSGELNVEVIQDLIKKLADELNGPTARDADSAPAGEAHVEPEAIVSRSAAALDTAARAMRASEPAAAPAPPLPPVPGSQLARIAEAVAAERFDVLIEPIHALSEGRARHYEVSMRLRTADGEQLEQADYTRAAQDSDLLPHIDAARMLRAARVARRLAERGRQGAVISALSGDSITDNGFLDAAGEQTANDGRVRLVLSFAQSDARNFTPAHAEALGTMAGAGFGFALEDVTDLEMDFGRLKALGFEFVKLDAQVFLDGMQAPGGCIPAADICRYLSEFGLTLIVGAIEDDWLLAKIMGFGVLLGKGTLFGGPRLIKAMEPKTAAA